MGRIDDCEKNMNSNKSKVMSNLDKETWVTIHTLCSIGRMTQRLKNGFEIAQLKKYND